MASMYGRVDDGRGSGVRFELSVRDISGLVANFHAADVEIHTALTQASRDAAALVLQIAQTICPVDTRFMRDHIRLYMAPSGLVWEIGWDASDFFAAGLAFYPFFVEYGTVKMAAQPTLGPAYEYVVPIYLANVEHLLRVAADRKRAT